MRTPYTCPTCGPRSADGYDTDYRCTDCRRQVLLRTPPNPGCRARQYSDQMHCSNCGLTWDMNDPHPPKCLR